MKTFLQKYKACLVDKSFLWSSTIAIVLFTASLVINFYAGTYAAEKASNPVTDLILSNIRVYDVDIIFIYGSFALVLLIAYLCLAKSQRIPFVIKSIALFVLVRSAFITLTHIGPFPTRIVISPRNIINDFTFGGDLFFSGHTGLPFLMALIFWEIKRLRILFIAFSIIFGMVTLLGHLHYSIDVMSALFITYTIHHISSVIFKKDKARLLLKP